MTSVLIRIRNFGLGVLLSGALLPSLLIQEARAEVSLATVEDYTSFPVIITQSATPLVMLAMSRDHQYWFKAYNDYTDLDPKAADGIETTYKHSIDYFGYFDPYKCYQHTNGRFEPKGWSPSDPKNAKYCDDVNGDWSGNFLNWATMTRMDIVRKILYGGKRSTDTSSTTVLERAHLPSDAHSFVKYYAGDDIKRLTPFGPKTQSDIAGGEPPENVGISICNTTEDWGDTPVSQTTTKPPLIRVAEGNFSLWASNERWQCRWGDDAALGWTSTPDRDSTNANDPAKSGIPAHPDNPLRGSHKLGDGDYIARVLVCDDKFYDDNDDEDGARAKSPGEDRADNCQVYPNGNAKPVGLLQEFGEDERIHFGLMTGSWQKNISGGVLRRNVGPMAEEINADTDGTFVPPKTGKDAGIITTLDRIRMYGYRYDNGTYRQNEGDNCTFQLASITEGECTAWGNPVSELYMEALRYFAGKSGPTSAFALKGASDHFNLPRTSWVNPLNADNACARLNTVVFNASVSSYDNDQMSSDLAGSPDFAALTDKIGDEEGITGTRAFIGRNGTDNDELCGPKTVNGLGQALGLCPEAPTVLGSYQMAGAAWHGHTTDMRGDLNGTQTVTAYAVALSTTVPKINIPLDPKDPDSRVVTILPAYRNIGQPSDPGGGALVDFKIVQPNTEVAPGVYTGKFYVNWEDSEQGGDYDQDMWGVLDYKLDANAGTITVTTESIAESTSTPQLFGFVISGTTQDGFHAYSGIEGADFGTGSPPKDDTGVPGCDDCNPSASGANAGTGQSGPQSHTFTLGPATAELLPSPLFFAAKWGGFIDTNDNGKPDKVEEWDAKDNDTGVEGADGLPDNYFFVTNPSGLQRSLRAVFKAIVARTASGTAAAVVANTQTGSGAAYQALYEPLAKDDNGNEVEWVGNLHALWVDQFGLLREDNPGGTPNGKLDDYNTDPVVDIFFDEDDHKTKIRRFSSSDSLAFIESGSTEHKLTDLSPIWSARDQLSPEPDFANVTLQRAYTTSADNGRYIFTWIDKNLDGDVDSGEQVELERSNITPSNFGYFDVATEAEAEDLVDYIRGAEVAGHRQRVVDIDGDGDTEIMRLGDIIHSTPTPVGTPSEALDVLFGDLSYAKFRKQYVNRRQVVYVGANDGMLHAFNAGFYDSASQEFKKQLNGETQHPLGSELWAYAPYNLLPHLKWLKDPNYTHVYYVDGKPRVFDAKIFPPDATHPDGWGTVLVVGFRLGGGDLTTDTAADGLSGDANDVTMRPAYVVLDITDPEQPPEVIAEITDPNLEYTTSYPAVAYFAATNKWYLVFGSGPNQLATATSDHNAYLYAFNMRAGASRVEIDLLNGFARNVSTISQGFVGDPLIVDWDLDGDADDLYFGVVEGGTQNPGGHLRKLEISGVDKPGSWPQSQKILTTGQPFLARPTSSADERGRRWIFASSGRLLVNGDKNDSKQQTLYGIIDGPPNKFALNGTEQVDTSDAVVYADESVSDVVDPDGDTITNFTELLEEVAEAGGWKYDYKTNGTEPSQRGIVDSALTGGILFNPAFTPGSDLCNAEGESELLGFYFKTGTPLPSPAVFGSVCSDGGNSCPDSELISLGSIDLGAGLASSPSIHAGAGHSDQEVSVVEQTSTGAIVLEKATTASGVLSGEVSWREYNQ